MKRNDERPNTVDSIETMLAILTSLKDLRGAGITELSKTTGVPKSTVHRHLKTLAQHEFVTRDSGKYKLSYKFLEFGGVVRRDDPYYEEIVPKVALLAEQTGEHVQYFVEENGVAIPVCQKRGEQAIRTDTHVGRRFNLHHTAAGKAILAALSDDEVRRVIDRHGLVEKTGNTLTDDEALFEELATIRERGVAINDEEGATGIKGVGVAIHLRDDTLIGAVSVVGPSFRFRERRIENEIEPLLLGVQNELAINLDYL